MEQDLLAFLIQSPADLCDTLRNDSRREQKESISFYFGSEPVDIWIQIWINREMCNWSPDQILVLAEFLNAVVVAASFHSHPVVGGLLALSSFTCFSLWAALLWESVILDRVQLLMCQPSQLRLSRPCVAAVHHSVMSSVRVWSWWVLREACERTDKFVPQLWLWASTILLICTVCLHQDSDVGVQDVETTHTQWAVRRNLRLSTW